MGFIFIHDLLSYNVVVVIEVLAVLHWCSRIEIIDVQAKISGYMFHIIYGTVNIHFSSSMETSGG